MAGNAAAMLLAGLCLAKPNIIYLYFAIALLVVNILLTFTDQFGLLDFITLLIDLALLSLLIYLRLKQSTIDQLE